MTKWLRNDAVKLAEIAGQVGLTPEESLRAITLGARFIARGYSDRQIDDMDQDYTTMRRRAWERWGL